MSAQRAQRECSYSEGVQEFGGSFVNIAAPLAALVVKKGSQALTTLKNHFRPERSLRLYCSAAEGSGTK